MPEPIKTPIEEGLIARITSAARYVITGASEAWMGPGQPMTPTADGPKDETKGRMFDYPVAVNMRQKPRSEQDYTVSYQDLRALADNFDLVRLCIETRKDQLATMQWGFRFKDKTKRNEDDPRLQQLVNFFQYPDRLNDWQTWLRILVEDLLVIDAPTLYPTLTRGGQLYSLDPVDGATIKRVIDGTGRTPPPPEPAYQQILKGMSAVDYTLDELIFRPRNMRSWRLYGFSPVEQIITTINIAMRRQLYQLQYYTEGNVPDSLFSVPDTWGPDQIKQFQDWWDTVSTGDNKRKGRFVPHGVSPIDTKANAMQGKDDQVMNEWLARVVCYCFNVAPTQLTASNNRATASTQQEVAADEGLAPLKQWVKNLMDFIVFKHFGFTDLEFFFPNHEELNPLVRAQINQIYLAARVLDPDEVRDELGKEPLTEEQRAKLVPAAGPNGANPFQSQGDQAVNHEQETNGPERKQDPTVKVDVHLGDTLVEVGSTIVKAEFPDGRTEEVRANVVP
jgi:phage portal protein BeeE